MVDLITVNRELLTLKENIPFRNTESTPGLINYLINFLLVMKCVNKLKK